MSSVPKIHKGADRKPQYYGNAEDDSVVEIPIEGDKLPCYVVYSDDEKGQEKGNEYVCGDDYKICIEAAGYEMRFDKSLICAGEETDIYLVRKKSDEEVTPPVGDEPAPEICRPGAYQRVPEGK